jgi:hypothetical protein
MSRHPSPGPSHPQPQTPQIFQQVTAPVRQKSKAYATGIAAGAEDVKYQAKYKELKRKVKEIEAVSTPVHIECIARKISSPIPKDNDKLHFRVLQAKRSIQRMKLERAYALLSPFCRDVFVTEQHTVFSMNGCLSYHLPQTCLIVRHSLQFTLVLVHHLKYLIILNESLANTRRWIPMTTPLWNTSVLMAMFESLQGPTDGLSRLQTLQWDRE